MRVTLALREAAHAPLIRFVGRHSVPRMPALELLSFLSLR